jgi:hypothetical protein
MKFLIDHHVRRPRVCGAPPRVSAQDQLSQVVKIADPIDSLMPLRGTTAALPV